MTITMSTSLHAFHRGQQIASQVQAARRRLATPPAPPLAYCDRHEVRLSPTDRHCPHCLLEGVVGIGAGRVVRFRTIPQIMRGMEGMKAGQ